jgi:hypothetical protein
MGQSARTTVSRSIFTLTSRLSRQKNQETLEQIYSSMIGTMTSTIAYCIHLVFFQAKKMNEKLDDILEDDGFAFFCFGNAQLLTVDDSRFCFAKARSLFLPLVQGAYALS